MPWAAAWMDWVIILLSEVRDRETNILKDSLQVEARNSFKWNNLQIETDSELKKPTHDYFFKKLWGGIHEEGLKGTHYYISNR